MADGAFRASNGRISAANSADGVIKSLTHENFLTNLLSESQHFPVAGMLIALPFVLSMDADGEVLKSHFL